MVHFTPAQLDKVNFSMVQFLVQHEHCNTNEDMAFGQSDHWLCSGSVKQKYSIFVLIRQEEDYFKN